MEVLREAINASTESDPAELPSSLLDKNKEGVALTPSVTIHDTPPEGFPTIQSETEHLENLLASRPGIPKAISESKTLSDDGHSIRTDRHSHSQPVSRQLIPSRSSTTTKTTKMAADPVMLHQQPGGACLSVIFLVNQLYQAHNRRDPDNCPLTNQQLHLGFPSTHTSRAFSQNLVNNTSPRCLPSCRSYPPNYSKSNRNRSSDPLSRLRFALETMPGSRKYEFTTHSHQDHHRVVQGVLGHTQATLCRSYDDRPVPRCPLER